MDKRNFLTGMHGVIKLYECMLQDICKKYGLSLLEANIVSFLHNYPQNNTGGDIVEYRMISKANVSKGVESLAEKGFLERKEDLQDRRKIRLILQAKAEPITEEIEKMRGSFFAKAFSGFTEENKREYFRFNDMLVRNTKSAISQMLKD